MKTQLSSITYKTPNGNYTVSKDNLAEAQAIFGNSNIGWPQCRDVKEGVEFFLDMCELFKLEFIPDDIPRGKNNYDSKNIYFGLCDAIALVDLPKDETTESDFSEFINKPIEADIYEVYHNRDVAPVDEPVKEVVVTSIEVTKEEPVVEEPKKTPVEILDEIIAEVEAAPTEEVSEDTNEETIKNNIEEELIMNNNTMNFGEIIEETAKEMAAENNNVKEDDAMSAQERIEEATNEAGNKVKESMGVINKYVVDFRAEADKIGKMPEKEVYNYVMGKIDGLVEDFSSWSGEKFAVVADALKTQKNKMKKAVKDVEDVADEEGLDEDAKASVMDSVKAFIGKVIKATVLVLKAATKLVFKLTGIVLTFGYRVGRTVVVEGINAGLGMKDAVVGTVKEVKEGFTSKTDDYDAEDVEFVESEVVENESFRTENASDSEDSNN